MTRGKQKIEAQKRAAERNEKPKGSQIEARSAGLKTVCSVCKGTLTQQVEDNIVLSLGHDAGGKFIIREWAPLANYKQLVDHFGSKHPKEAVPPARSS